MCRSSAAAEQSRSGRVSCQASSVLEARPGVAFALTIVVIAVSTGCSALTGFGDLAFDDDDAAIDAATTGRDAERDDGGPRDAAMPPSLDGAMPLDGAMALDGAMSLDGAMALDGAMPLDGATPLDGSMSLDGAAPGDLGPPPRDASGARCDDDTDCDDSNPCTRDLCNLASRTCGISPLTGDVCSDGNACTTDDRCMAGLCRGSDADRCVPTGPCVTSTCDPAIGCVEAHSPRGVACDDGNACTPSSTCDGAGLCFGATACPSDDNPCTADVCIGAECQAVALADGTACIAGRCCNGSCASTNTDEANCGSCGNSCGSGQSCVSGFCSTCGSDEACDDGLACTIDRCVGTCANSLMPDHCLIGGLCFMAGADNPSNVCQQCRPALSSTAWSAKDGTPPCNDLRFCTATDVCVEGVCQGSGDPCNTSPCYEELCNETDNECVRVGPGCPVGQVCCGDDRCILIGTSCM